MAEKFTVKVEDSLENGFFAPAHYSKMFGVEGGEEVSPKITWSGVPAGTKSFVLTIFDPDAPTESGFWHWAIKDIPGNITSLEADAGNPKSGLMPKEVVPMPNDTRLTQYVGPAPVKGDAPHNYHFILTALNVETLDIPLESTPAFMDFSMIEHTLGKAKFIVKGQQL
ncbi:YbhB/YbcL family Raf kinase inhibitor-like protein [Bacillus tropicus]|uniref:YbhB/YbcL family Raf kinase inhibitor-like protein n=1 Tax=Bacillus tropicus TaxID=2026188 RepID=UPI00381AA02F